MTATRVLHMHFGKDGGAERFFVSLAQALAERGVEQRFVVRPNRSWRDEIAPHGEIIENHFRRLSVSGLMLPGRIRRMAEDWRPDAMMSWMPRAARLMPDMPGVTRLTRLGDYPKNLKHFGQSDLLVANTPGIAERCKALGWEKPVKVISNFVRQVDVTPVDRAAIRHAQGRVPRRRSGRFVPRKGFDAILRAVAQVPDAWLWIAGTGEREAEVRALAKELGVMDRTRFLGWLDEPMHAMAACDAYLMASRHEPLGNVVLEAWHAEVPVISTRSEGPSWFATDGQDALMVDIDGVDQMADALRRLKADPDLRQRLRDGGRATLGARFTRDSIAEQYLAVFRSGA
jgi:glycosyltransferase involved in cell wall biosynthesis